MENELTKVVAVVVTYNRQELLRECLSSLMNQTTLPYKVVVVDNASTDGSKEYLKELEQKNPDSLKMIFLPQNIGGSGGFYEGMKFARENYDYDYLWLMDDDTIPEPDCLKGLLETASDFKAKQEYFGFLSSTILTSNKKEYMNVPVIDYATESNGYSSWHRNLDICAVKIATATFVSILFPSEAIKKCGFPVRDYFIWGDDTEYTTRVNKYYAQGYLTGKSLAVHKRKGEKPLSFEGEENPNRLKMYYYMFRNQIINRIFYENYRMSWYAYVRYIVHKLALLKQKKGMLKYRVLVKGTYDGAFKNESFVDFIREQINSITK